WWRYDCRGLEPIFGGVGGADFHDLPRLDRNRIASQRTRNGGAGNAEHFGDYSAWTKRLRIRDSEGASPDDRSQETCLRRFKEIHRRPARAEAAGGTTAIERVGGATSQA